MLLKLKGIVTFKQFQNSSAPHYLMEDVFIGDAQLREKLEEAQLKDNVFLCFETHYLKGAISYFDKNHTAGGRSLPEKELRGLTNEPNDPTPTLTPFYIGERDLLAVFREYLGKEIILWATDSPFTDQDFFSFGTEHFCAFRSEAALMCLANALYMSNDELYLDHGMRFICRAIVCSNPDTMFDVKGLHAKVEEIFNRYLNTFAKNGVETKRAIE